MKSEGSIMPIDNERKSSPLTVFILTGGDSSCSECGKGLFKGDFLFKEGDRGICMQCADMDHLLFLPSGDAVLTRRAKKLSKLSAVVVKWSRARKRYERQGILCEEDALNKAEELCLKDKDLRKVRRDRDRIRRIEQDNEFKADFAKAIISSFPGCPPDEAEAIANHTCLKHSGRIGRSSAAKSLEYDAINLAVTAYIRHIHTDYDVLLMQGWERHEAREEVQAKTDKYLSRWKD